MKPTVSRLKKKLDALVSEYVRRRGSDDMDRARCVSCGLIGPWNTLQNGHYVSRSNLNTRWDLRNCHIQCVGCNVFKKGNYPAYTKYLLEQNGEKWLQTLIADGEKIRKWNILDLQNEILKFQELIKTL